jgi:hypothetical protein
LKLTLTLALTLSALPALAQLTPKEADSLVHVLKPRGEFAKKLDGQTTPSGKGWKPVTDRERLVQLMLPASWKTEVLPAGETTILRATPPGSETDLKGVLLVTYSVPGDDDPVEIDEPAALSYADDLAEQPALKRLQFQATDAGFVLTRGLRFALAGGTMLNRQKQLVRQQQLVYVAQDRLVTVQFTALDKEFAKLADDVARIFASYTNLGSRKVEEAAPDK